MMWRLPESEVLFYGGIAVMSVAVVLALLCIIVFTLSGRRIRRKLEQEYGEIRGKQKWRK